ncbi:hypothetical protein [Thermus caliditerrae]|uniref:hypothetical protein n=1 Tax=Thermus caliditerrae TaxID=1330700 RepID=UPI001F334F7A|nr:hypothetical protein [Thermus caliditerrae]
MGPFPGADPGPGQGGGERTGALLELLERLGAEGLAGKVVVGDAGFLYPEVARGVRAKGGSTSWS